MSPFSGRKIDPVLCFVSTFFTGVVRFEGTCELVMEQLLGQPIATDTKSGRQNFS